MPKKGKPYFPLFVDLSEKRIYVIGAGTIAKRRIRSLVDFTNHLTVIAKEVNPELLSMEAEGQIRILKKRLELDDIKDADLVIAATNDHMLNDAVYQYCKENAILVNVCSNKDKCDFYFPGLIHTDEIVIGVTANGTNHKKARIVTESIREIIK